MKRILVFCCIISMLLTFVAFAQTSDTDGILEVGSKGDEVRELQVLLNDLGYSVGLADGVFGNKTKAAIEQFQQDNGLEVTGIVDNGTLTQLNEQGAMVRTLKEILEWQNDSPFGIEGARSDYQMAYSLSFPGGMNIYPVMSEGLAELPVKLSEDAIPYGWLMIVKDDGMSVAYRTKSPDWLSVSKGRLFGAGSSMATLLQTLYSNGYKDDCTFVDYDAGKIYYFGTDGVRHTDEANVFYYTDMNAFCAAFQ